MRRYRVVVTPGGQTQTIDSGVIQSGVTSQISGVGARSLIWDSQSTTINGNSSGQDNMGALDISFDVNVMPQGVDSTSGYVEIHGVSLQDVSNIRRWQGGTLSLYGGFSSGFPLANAKQYGLLAKWYVYQAFGNWTGIHQSIVFILTPNAKDAPIAFQWKVGQKLSDAISSSIASPYPGYALSNKLTNDPVAMIEDAHYCASLYELATFIQTKTLAMGLATKIGGIQMQTGGTTLYLYDAPNAASPIRLAFNDFQGQPVDFGSGVGNEVQTTLNLRSDLVVGGLMQFPSQISAGYLLQQPKVAAPLDKDNSAVTGNYYITSIRHLGRFREPSGASWVTIVNGVPWT